MPHLQSGPRAGPAAPAHQAIRQRVSNAASSIRVSHREASGSYPALAMVQAGVSELVRVYGAEAVAGLLAELAAELSG